MTEQLSDRLTGVVAEVMTEEVLGVTPIATATEVAELMREHHVREVFVVEEGRLQGRVTDRDLVVRVLAAGLDPLGARAASISSDVPAALSPGMALDRAAQIMDEQKASRLPVVDAQGRSVGTLSMGDLARHAVSESMAAAGAVPPQR